MCTPPCHPVFGSSVYHRDSRREVVLWGWGESRVRAGILPAVFPLFVAGNDPLLTLRPVQRNGLNCRCFLGLGALFSESVQPTQRTHNPLVGGSNPSGPTWLVVHTRQRAPIAAIAEETSFFGGPRRGERVTVSKPRFCSVCLEKRWDLAAFSCGTATRSGPSADSLISSTWPARGPMVSAWAGGWSVGLPDAIAASKWCSVVNKECGPRGSRSCPGARMSDGEGARPIPLRSASKGD